MRSYTLGLDIGSKSIGWALVETGEKPSIIDMGVRVFPEGVDRDKGGETSKYKGRREARGARRIIKRRRFRKDRLINILKGTGLLPQGKEELQRLLRDENVKDGQQRDMCPYKLRSKGLRDKLKLYEFGRVLYHLAQRRGFKSNSKTGKQEEKGEVAKEATELENQIKKAGCETLGEYFAKLDPHKERVRGWYTFRKMYVKEFDSLWKEQTKYNSDILTEDLRKKVEQETLFFQRPLRSSEHLIGECDLEPGEKRCPRGDWYARRFRLLQDVNNLKIRSRDGSERQLNEKEREIVLGELSGKETVPFSSLRKKLQKELGDTLVYETTTFNFEEEGRREKLKGDTFAAAMTKILGRKKWSEMPEDKKININTDLLELDDDSFLESMTKKHGLTEDQAEKILNIELPGKYMHFSRKAIQKLLPLMEGGKMESEAKDEVYKQRADQKGAMETGELGLPPNLRNPLVQSALCEVRKLLGNLIQVYGKPAKIAIEMARDVKGSKEERLAIQDKMRENEKINRKAIEELRKARYEPSSENILKYKLWEECGYKCVYTGRSISATALFSSSPEFQVEHILPYKRTLDDSYMNKTLCEVHENNLVKKNQTPYEAYSHNGEKYEQIKQRIKVLPWPKRKRFLQDKFDELDECISRELNDTRYICKEVVKYLKQVGGIIVKGTKGRTTAAIRHWWGLDTILNANGSAIKNRADHRHHAIDATVVAVTTEKHLHALAISRYSDNSERFGQPWPHFREELEEKIKHILVSHRPTKKTSGKLHEDTSYGLTGEVKKYFQEGRLKKLGQNTWLCEDTLNYIYSRPLDELLKKVVDLDNVPKDATNVIEALKQRIRSAGVDINDKEAKIPDGLFEQPVFIKASNGADIPVRKVRVRVPMSNMIIFTDEQNNPYRACPAGVKGGNHHVEIIEKVENGQKKSVAKIVTRIEAAQRRCERKAVVQKDHGPNAKFISSLAMNDMVLLPAQEGSMELYRVQKMDVNGTVTYRHHTAATLKDNSQRFHQQACKFNGKKVAVDMLGRVKVIGDTISS